MSRSASVFFITGICSFSVFAGCAKETPQAQSTSVPISTIGQSNAEITDEEALAFARKFADGAQRNDVVAVNSAFDWETLADRSLEGTGLTAHERSEVKQSMLMQLKSSNAIVAQVNQVIAQGGSYQFLRIHEVDGRKRAILRLLLPEGGVNYHDFVLSKGSNGQCRGIDIHIFLSGEFLSTTMKRLMLAMTASRDRSLLARLTGKDQMMATHQNVVMQLTTAQQTGNYAEALRLFNTLPVELQHDKSLMLTQLVATLGAGDGDRYQTLLADFRTHHPNDACIDFLSIDYFITRQEYPEALAAIEAVSQSVGGDPYLDFMLGNVHFLSGDLDAAEKLFQASIDAEPTLQDGWWSMVTLSLKRQDFDRTLAVLKELDQRFIVEWIDLSQHAEYAEFVASPQHAEWLAYLAAKPGTGQPVTE